MMQADDPRLIEAKAKSVDEVLSLLKITDLRKTPNPREMTGPCPACGMTGHNPKGGLPDRFNINLTTGAFFCRKGCMKGGDVIALVRAVENCSFREALTFLCGEAPIHETEEKRRAREKKQAALAAELEKKARETERAAARYRERAIDRARTIWRSARPGHLGVVAAYLRARGIDPERLGSIPAALRFIADHPYVKTIDGQAVTLHRGPCMIAGILDMAGDLTAVHQTWVSATPPHGKAKIAHDETPHAAKLVRGAKKSGAIRLITPPGAETLVMGEGIETTLSAAVADAVPGAAYWSGVDLGNMSGIMQRVAGTRWSGLPDMADTRAFVPPAWVKRLIFIMDGDSAHGPTRAQLESGLRRAMALRPGLRGQIVHAGEGVDLNDVLVGAAPPAPHNAATGEGDSHDD